MELLGKPLIFGLGGIGLVALVASAVMEFYGNNQVLTSVLSKEMSLNNGSEAMKRWQKPPQAMIFRVYLFNVTNANEVDKGRKPVLAQVGPYAYDQWQEKVEVKEEGDDTYSYRLKKSLYFNAEASGCHKESDIVTIINLPLIGTILTVEKMMPDALGQLDSAWPELFPNLTNAFITASVKDILFDGITIKCVSKEFMVAMLCKYMKGNVPETIRPDGRNFKFSFFHHKNQTSTVSYRVYRGNKDIKKVSQTYSYNNETAFTVWEGPYCNMMNGSDGAQFPVNLEKKGRIYLFQPDFCRSLFAQYEKEVDQGGLKLFKYVNNKDLFDYVGDNIKNDCFCSSVDDDDENDLSEEAPTTTQIPKGKMCPKKGSLLLTSCIKAPVVISFPHFYMGDESFLNFTGLKPKKQDHETFVEVEPLTGTPVNGFRRIQFNVEVKPLSQVQVMRKLPSGLFPALWVEEGVQLTEENFEKLKSSLSTTWILHLVTYILLGGGISFVIAAYALYAKKQKLCCWESSIAEHSIIRQGQDNQAFGINGTYRDKIKLSTTRFDVISQVKPFNGIIKNASEDPNATRSRKNSQAFRRQSNVVSYVENFM